MLTRNPPHFLQITLTSVLPFATWKRTGKTICTRTDSISSNGKVFIRAHCLSRRGSFPFFFHVFFYIFLLKYKIIGTEWRDCLIRFLNSLKLFLRVGGLNEKWTSVGESVPRLACSKVTHEKLCDICVYVFIRDLSWRGRYEIIQYWWQLHYKLFNFLYIFMVFVFETIRVPCEWSGRTID